MRFLFIAIIFALTSSAGAETIDTASIVAAATGDFNKDGASDLVMLTRNAYTDMDVRFFLQDVDGKYLTPAYAAPGKIWGHAEPDGIVGQEPDLKVLSNGSVQITTRNDAVGRDRWTEILTVAYRNKDFVVAGITYNWYDTLDPDNNGTCDINLLSGKGAVSKPDSNGKPGKSALTIKPMIKSLRDWSEEDRPEGCGG